MNVGVCGICCDVCGLREKCQPCCSAKSKEAELKMKKQIEILGSTCPFIECAKIKGHDYCSRDCGEFPCEKYKKGPYPYSEGFIQMYCRRKNM
ncbi:MAG: DUF3795 domain-containing protein [Clostridia bacterium]|nr:DUF3795 domain-containing protein [Clostridia bacterium]